jgi:hypothetical protein
MDHESLNRESRGGVSVAAIHRFMIRDRKGQKRREKRGTAFFLVGSQKFAKRRALGTVRPDLLMRTE